ncbi:hypothetical protein [Kitasatospora sp. NPDC088134]|uniref:hypothetical protein n=1 Tax=Kitasatospora sp. NPDC088134 TaxID=3364071 RepID=UPI003818DB21
MDPHHSGGADPQDRADFEYALGRALADPAMRAALAGDPGRAVRLRALARSRAPQILAAAEAEHLAYRRLREAAEQADRAGGRDRLSGWFGALALVVPVVTGSAAAVFFLLGSVIGLSRPHDGLAGPLRTAAWTSVALTVTSALIGLLGLLLTAARTTGTAQLQDERLSAARAAWHAALLHRGLLPFLLPHAAETLARQQD